MGKNLCTFHFWLNCSFKRCQSICSAGLRLSLLITTCLFSYPFLSRWFCALYWWPKDIHLGFFVYFFTQTLTQTHTFTFPLPCSLSSYPSVSHSNTHTPSLTNTHPLSLYNSQTNTHTNSWVKFIQAALFTLKSLMTAELLITRLKGCPDHLDIREKELDNIE